MTWSVRNEFSVRCPKCKADDRLKVEFTSTALLTPHGSEDCGNHEWDDDSAITCGHCGAFGTVKGFTI